MKNELIETKDTIRELTVTELDEVAGGSYNIKNYAWNLGVGQQNTGISSYNINVGVGKVSLNFISPDPNPATVELGMGSGL